MAVIAVALLQKHLKNHNSTMHKQQAHVDHHGSFMAFHP